jgi:hypothetical protein
MVDFVTGVTFVVFFLLHIFIPSPHPQVFVPWVRFAAALAGVLSHPGVGARYVFFFFPKCIFSPDTLLRRIVRSAAST